MKVFAKDVMHQDVKTVRPELNIADLIARFASDDVSGFPVVAEDSVIGIVSSTDVFRCADKKEAITVQDIMSRDIVSVLPSTTLHDAAAVMSEKHIHRVLVLDNEKLVGVLSALDIVRACGNERIDISFAPPKIRDF